MPGPDARRGVTFLELLIAIALLSFLALACVTWDGATYDAVADREVLALKEALDAEPLSPGRCEAHRAAAAALANEEGTSRSLYVPLATGPKIEGLGRVHARQAVVCDELVSREVRGLSLDHRARTRAAWAKTWENGRALAGAGEEEN